MPDSAEGARGATSSAKALGGKGEAPQAQGQRYTAPRLKDPASDIKASNQAGSGLFLTEAAPAGVRAIVPKQAAGEQQQEESVFHWLGPVKQHLLHEC